MKTLFKCSSVIFLFLSSAASAVWTSSVIDYIQMPSTGTLVYIYLQDPVTFDNCPNTTSLNRMIIRKPASGSENNFDEVYAQLMVYQQSNKPITVLSTSGTCAGTTSPFIDGPYIRFE